ncbi:hypothetical protein AYJ54_36615 [Bradyrhizobium centrolobii]|uniref:Uncharacterized protein n=1 Tax=Bradyrhizobium centrolobii TaxID=1505087 RepID=A0A176Y6G0_9BRAD|nr:hypothetical protein AYJ54_36615 [Bradyrhizobium centrolobii]
MQVEMSPIGLSPTSCHVGFCAAIRGQADINSGSSDRLRLLGIIVDPASLIRLASAIFMILGVLTRT